MAQTEIPTINRYFENITDPRRENKRHKLIDDCHLRRDLQRQPL